MDIELTSLRSNVKCVCGVIVEQRSLMIWDQSCPHFNRIAPRLPSSPCGGVAIWSYGAGPHSGFIDGYDECRA